MWKGWTGGRSDITHRDTLLTEYLPRPSSAVVVVVVVVVCFPRLRISFPSSAMAACGHRRGDCCMHSAFPSSRAIVPVVAGDMSNKRPRQIHHIILGRPRCV